MGVGDSIGSKYSAQKGAHGVGRSLAISVACLCSALSPLSQAQSSQLTKEYIRLSGTVIAIESGGRARQFASTGDKINWGDLPNSPLRVVGDLSIGMWIKLPSNAQGCLVCDASGGALNSSTAWPYFMS